MGEKKQSRIGVDTMLDFRSAALGEERLAEADGGN
jgi:hypothetical protein